VTFGTVQRVSVLYVGYQLSQSNHQRNQRTYHVGWQWRNFFHSYLRHAAILDAMWCRARKCKRVLCSTYSQIADLELL